MITRQVGDILFGGGDDRDWRIERILLGGMGVVYVISATDDTKHVDIRSDIYSFGVMLFQMITGRLPFVGRSWKMFESLHKTELPPTHCIEQNSLRGILEICLAKEKTRPIAYGWKRRSLPIFTFSSTSIRKDHFNRCPISSSPTSQKTEQTPNDSVTP
jgi:serine/threonine protein kinase